MLRKIFAGLFCCLVLMNAASAQIISPTTGLPIAREPVAPMLVVITNTESNVEYNGHTTKAQGVGRADSWQISFMKLRFIGMIIPD
ncbi:MAG: hypothetical protein IKU70_12830 [Clostridia bacterium]|nr:hypothetical protein [Clostridia bacterium]